MRYEVRLTEDAEADVEELFAYIEKHDSLQSADYVLTGIENVFASLSSEPHRGVYPPELAVLGIREYRESFFKPYRIIYRVLNKSVFVYVVADGRRDMQTLLKRRLLSA